MSKVKIKVFLKNDDQTFSNKCQAFKTKNKIIYKLDDYKVTLFLDENLKLEKEDNNFLTKLEFKPKKESKGSILIKDKNILMDIIISTDYIKIEYNLIEIKYKVLTTSNDVLYKVEVMYE